MSACTFDTSAKQCILLYYLVFMGQGTVEVKIGQFHKKLGKQVVRTKWV